MGALDDLLGADGVLRQLVLYQLMGQVVSALITPGITALTQDTQAAHPDTALDPVTAADLLARGMMPQAQAQAEAAKNGINAARFADLARLHKIRLSPADLATAVLRSAQTLDEAEAQARPQGVTPDMLAVLIALAGDAPGPQQLAEALRREIIPENGTGPDAVTFQQGIAESRLYPKWADVIKALSQVLLSPPDAASAVVRNFLAKGDAAELARKQGVDAQTLDLLIHLSADAPGPQQLAEALRRGEIEREGTGPDSTSFEQGIAEGRLANKWAGVIEALSRLWPTPVDAIDAAVKGQIPKDQAQALYERLGGDPQFYAWLLSSAGEGPTPLEAAQMAARGIIDWHGSGPESTSFDQAVRESHYRDKWTGAYKKISEYIPPPGEIITFLAHNAITHDRAADLLAMHDMDQEVIAAFLNEAELTALSDYRGLTQSAVTDMYYARLIGHDQAIQILTELHVTPRAAELLLAYADLRQVIDSITKSVQRIGQLYTGRKIGEDTATQALIGLGIPGLTVQDIIGTWQIQAAANVKTLTQAEIVNAWYYQIIDDATAIAELGAIGYTPYDSWILLSLKAKGPLPNQPARDVAPPPGAVIPGVT